MTDGTDADVIVCGGGMAGLCAAVKAAEAGARVLLVEKSDELGGNLRLSAGLVWTYRTVETAHARVPFADPGLLKDVVEGLADGLEWLRKLGVKTWSYQPDPSRGGGALDPASLITRLESLLRGSGCETRRRTSVVGASAVAGRVVARLRDEESGAEWEHMGKTLVLCSGGYQGSDAFLQALGNQSNRDLVLRCAAGSVGDGLRIALDCGCSLQGDLGGFYGHAIADVGPRRHLTGEEVRALTQYYGHYSVAVNRKGVRFADESVGNNEERLNEALAREPEATGFYIVDSMIARERRMPDGGTVGAAIQRAKEFGCEVIVAETLEDLAGGLETVGVPGGSALAALAEYNGHVREGFPVAIWPPRAANRHALVEPPYMAVKVRAGITFTTGGIAVGRDMRVLRRRFAPGGLSLAEVMLNQEVRAASGGPLWVTDGRVFAAGADVGGISYGGYAGGLATALVTGRKAGAVAAGMGRSGEVEAHA